MKGKQGAFSKAVEAFAQTTFHLTDPELERTWRWGEYNEGVRFAFFRIYEELRGLAVRLEAERNASSNPLSQAQRALGQYHSAFRDLQAVLFGVSDEDAERPPAEGEWSLKATLLHMVQAQRAFFFIAHYALERARGDGNLPAEPSDESWEIFWISDGFVLLEKGCKLSELCSYYADFHEHSLKVLADITDGELSELAVFWEKRAMPLRFRLGRFDSHLRQHTVQIEKTLAAIGPQPNEARRLLRLVYAALAEAESYLCGAGEQEFNIYQDTMKAIQALTSEVAKALKDNG